MACGSSSPAYTLHSTPRYIADVTHITQSRARRQKLGHVMKVDVLLFPLSRGDIKGDNCAILIGGVYAAADDDVDGGPVVPRKTPGG